MDLLTRMDLALAYVENNLTGEIDQEVLARIACCSIYNFSRMFSFITDISLTEYIRRRRLTMAAMELQQGGNIKVIDLALKYVTIRRFHFHARFEHSTGLHRRKRALVV